MSCENYTQAEIVGGYVLLSRMLPECSLWQLSPHHTRVSVYLLLSARHKKKTINLPTGDQIKRGDLVTSLSIIADNCSYFENRKLRTWSRRKVAEMLDDLDEIGFLKHNSNRSGTHISICNYGTYQDPDKYNSNTGTTQEQHENNTEGTQPEHTLHTNNKDKNGKKEEKGNKANTPKALIAIAQGMVECNERKELLTEWLEYRIALKKPMKTDVGIKRMVKEWSKYTNEQIKVVMDFTISKEYQGMIWDKATPSEKSDKTDWENI